MLRQARKGQANRNLGSSSSHVGEHGRKGLQLREVRKLSLRELTPDTKETEQNQPKGERALAYSRAKREGWLRP